MPESNLVNVETSVPICPELRWTQNPVTLKWTPKFWYCRGATCNVCAPRKSTLQGNRILEHAFELPCHHVILTHVHSATSLRQQVDDLFHHFRVLRKRVAWRRSVNGGARFLHVTYEREMEKWGPHLHLIVETDNPTFANLSKAWQKITGHSWVVEDLVIPENDDQYKEKAIHYASKWAFLTFADDPVAMKKFRAATKGRRLAAVFGGWYGKIKLSI